MRSRLSPSLLGIAMLLFLLPWFDVSCGGQRVMSFTGTDMAIGKTLEQSQFFGVKSKSETVRDLRVTGAFGLLLLGCALGFWAGDLHGLRKTVVAVSAIGSLLLLVIFKAAANGEVAREGQGMIALSFGAGYWLTLLCLIVAPLLEFTAHLAAPLASAVRGSAPAVGAAPRYCPNCGSPLVAGDRFCGGCGTSAD